MKIISYVCSLGAVAFVLGCNRASDNGSGASTDNQSISSGTSSSVDTRSTTAKTAQPDNTGTNVRDRDNNTLTPGDQGQNQADVDLTRRIRRAVTSNGQLSTDAKNVKIIATNGKVTLRGPVKSE